MNPDTGVFHELTSDLEEESAENKGWARFARNETISIKGQQFRVIDIGRTHVVLRSLASEA